MSSPHLTTLYKRPFFTAKCDNTHPFNKFHLDYHQVLPSLFQVGVFWLGGPKLPCLFSLLLGGIQQKCQKILHPMRPHLALGLFPPCAHAVAGISSCVSTPDERVSREVAAQAFTSLALGVFWGLFHAWFHILWTHRCQKNGQSRPQHRYWQTFHHPSHNLEVCTLIWVVG